MARVSSLFWLCVSLFIFAFYRAFLYRQCAKSAPLQGLISLAHRFWRTGVSMATISERKKKDGSISYRAEIRIKQGGKVVYREAETWPKRKLAEQWAAQREAELANPATLAALIAGRDEKPITVAELIGRYIKEVYPLRPWGRTKTDTLRLIAESDFGKLLARDVVASDIIAHCRNWGASPATMTQHYISIRGVFSVARELLRCDVQYAEVDIAQRTMSKLRIISKSAERDRRPTVEEMPR